MMKYRILKNNDSNQNKIDKKSKGQLIFKKIVSQEVYF